MRLFKIFTDMPVIQLWFYRHSYALNDYILCAGLIEAKNEYKRNTKVTKKSSTKMNTRGKAYHSLFQDISYSVHLCIYIKKN